MTGTARAPIEAALALVPRIRDLADQVERERRLPAQLVEALAAAGMFRLCVPRSLGGSEADAATMVRVIELLAEADGSTAWCAMIGATSGLVSAYLPEDVAREIYAASPDVVTGGVFAPRGTAVAADGGYRVTGRWPFASGCEHCAWLMGGCVVLDEGLPRLAGRIPDSRLMFFPAASAEVIDTWTVSGLCGTGSHDIAVSDLLVPAERSVSLITDRPREPGPLYAFPVFGLLALGIAGVAIGVARGAIDELTRLAAVKTPTASRRRLADRSVVQGEVARGEAMLRSARAFLFEAVGEAWEAAVASGAISIEQRALVRLAATHATRSAASVVDLMYDAGGGSSVYATSLLQRQFRDIHVVTQHMMVAPPTYELTGRLILGVDTDTSML